MKVGTKYRSQNSTAEIIVIRGTSEEVDLTCAGASMVAVARPGTRPSPAPSPAGAAEGERLAIGKRYVDGETGVEVICTTAGTGPVCIDGRPLTVAAAKLLPTGD